jgi:hypothetical protein
MLEFVESEIDLPTIVVLRTMTFTCRLNFLLAGRSINFVVGKERRAPVELEVFDDTDSHSVDWCSIIMEGLLVVIQMEGRGGRAVPH